MAISCQPADLASAAKCFTCLPPVQQLAIQTYLLAVQNGGSVDPKTLLESAKCFQCLSVKQLEMVIVYLLCQLVNK